MKTRAIVKKLSQGLIVLLIFSVLVGLGKWQLDRSVIVKESNAAAKVIDPKIYSLQDLATPTSPLDSRNVNKSVSVSGFYVANFLSKMFKGAEFEEATDFDIYEGEKETVENEKNYRKFGFI